MQKSESNFGPPPDGPQDQQQAVQEQMRIANAEAHTAAGQVDSGGHLDTADNLTRDTERSPTFVHERAPHSNSAALVLRNSPVGDPMMRGDLGVIEQHFSDENAGAISREKSACLLAEAATLQNEPVKSEAQNPQANQLPERVIIGSTSGRIFHRHVSEDGTMIDERPDPQGDTVGFVETRRAALNNAVTALLSVDGDRQSREAAVAEFERVRDYPQSIEAGDRNADSATLSPATTEQGQAEDYAPSTDESLYFRTRTEEYGIITEVQSEQQRPPRGLSAARFEAAKKAVIAFRSGDSQKIAKALAAIEQIRAEEQAQAPGGLSAAYAVTHSEEHYQIGDVPEKEREAFAVTVDTTHPLYSVFGPDDKFFENTVGKIIRKRDEDDLVPMDPPGSPTVLTMEKNLRGDKSAARRARIERRLKKQAQDAADERSNEDLNHGDTL